MGAADAAGLGGVTSGGSTARPDRRFDDATALVAAVAAGELSPVEAMERALARMEEVNPALNAVVHPRAERALEEARGLSDAPAAGFAGRHRPLAGVPIAVKDLGCEQAGEPHHRGSRLLAEAGRREHEDSHLYGLLAGAGAVSLGRTNTPEFGTTITTEPAVYGPTANPWSLGHSAGGSSGGSAAAVAAGIVTVAHGNDGGGSVRIPASACGLVGLKPTRGRVSTGPHRGEHRGGLAVDAMLTRTVRDAALCLDVVSVPAVGDPYGVAGPPAASPSGPPAASPVGRLRIAFHEGRATPPVRAAVAAAAALVERLGHEVVADRHPPDWFDDELADRLIVVRTMALAAELDGWASRLGRAVGEDDVEPANWWSAQLGRSLPATEYLRAQDWMNSWRRRVAAFWRAGAAHDSRAEDDDRFDLLLTPVLGDVTPPLGRLSDPVEGARRLRALLGFVDQANVTGQPAISLPTAMADPAPAGPALAGLAAPAGRAMPVGVQLVAASGNEALLLAVAQQVSDADGFVPLPELPSAP